MFFRDEILSVLFDHLPILPGLFLCDILVGKVVCRATKCSPTQYAPFRSILCTLHTHYATRGAYCVGWVHMLFQWSSEGTQYALLENTSRGMFAFFLTVLSTTSCVSYEPCV